MILAKHVGLFIFALGMLSLAGTLAHAQQQWNGAANSKGTIWRPGDVVVGEEPQRGDDPRPLIGVTRPLASSTDQDDRLFSANMVYKGNTSPKFEVDTRRAYAGGARSKARRASCLPTWTSQSIEEPSSGWSASTRCQGQTTTRSW